MSKSKIKTIIIVVIAIIILAFAIRFIPLKNAANYNLVDSEVYDALVSEMELSYSEIDSPEEYRLDITSWAIENYIEYEEDKNGNIIITKEASPGLERSPATIICTEYNSKIANEQIRAIATVKYLAKYVEKTGKLSLIFLNNELNENVGIRGISESYFGDDGNIIYLTAGSKMRMSVKSYAMAKENIVVPLEIADRTCDTGIKINISGISYSEIGSDIGKYPNPLSQLSTIMTRLNEKSTSYELADLNVKEAGNMYPISLEVTLLTNSYSLEEITKYLDKRIEKVTSDFSSTCPDITFTYEIIEDDEGLPSQVYSSSTVETLNNYLFTSVNGTYKFKEGQAIPQDSSVGEVFAINCLSGVDVTEGAILIHSYTSAVDVNHINTVLKDNKTAAEFTGASVSNTKITDAFYGNQELADDVSDIYQVSNKGSNLIPMKNDTFFTGCTYIQEISPGTKCAHLVESKKTGAKITNALMNHLIGRSGNNGK